ncbi:MAG: low-specificity L-threonine aldolase [Firmicutes bacterium]|nr:low-specificity L-threonine aldolase [Bacillota bacterium]
MAEIIDLRSDTVTTPTEKMREAMHRAAVGDDVYGEDPTMNRLEALAAEKVGKEAAIFLPSGTMGNQVAVMTHTQRGDEIILDPEAHLYYYEVGALAALSSVQARPAQGLHGKKVNVEAIEAAIRDKNIHFPKTRLICLENTHNRGGGSITPPEEMQKVAELAKRHGLAIHLDGARIFNAAVASGRDAREFTRYADSVMFCLSKGLSAPVGSMLAGNREFIERARKNRKMLGGGMRQAGILAAAGILALEEMIQRLAEDHANARLLAEGLAALPGVEVDLAGVETNIVAMETRRTGITGEEFSRRMAARGVKANASAPYRIRFVTHKDVTRQQIEKALDVIREIVA